MNKKITDILESLKDFSEKQYEYVNRVPDGDKIYKFLANLDTKQDEEKKKIIKNWILFLSGLFIFFIFLIKILINNNQIHSQISYIDQVTSTWLYFIRNIQATNFWTWITSLGEPLFIISIITSVSLILLIINKRKIIIPFIVMIGTGATTNLILKYFFARERPLDISVYKEGLFSFPSWHATIAVLLYGYIDYLIFRNIKSFTKRILLRIPIFILIILICISRLYLGAHYASDVIAGFIFGSILLNIGIFFSEYFSIDDKSKETNIKIQEINTKNNFLKNKNNIIILIIILQIVYYILFNIFYKYQLNIKA